MIKIFPFVFLCTVILTGCSFAYTTRMTNKSNHHLVIQVYGSFSELHKDATITTFLPFPNNKWGGDVFIIHLKGGQKYFYVMDEIKMLSVGCRSGISVETVIEKDMSIQMFPVKGENDLNKDKIVRFYPSATISRVSYQKTQ